MIAWRATAHTVSGPLAETKVYVQAEIGQDISSLACFLPYDLYSRLIYPVQGAVRNESRARLP